METNINLVNLLHDTYLKEIKQDNNNNLIFCFVFYLTDNKEYTITLLSKDTSNIHCLEYDRQNTQKAINFYLLKNIDCIQVEHQNDNIKMIFENTENDTVVKIEYISKLSYLSGNIEQLKEFWDLT